MEHEQRLRERDAELAELRQRMREMDEERERLRRVGGGAQGGEAGEVVSEPLDRGREFAAGTPYPEVNYMPTDTDPDALEQMVRRGRPRGFSAPEREEVGVGWG